MLCISRMDVQKGIIRWNNGIEFLLKMIVQNNVIFLSISVMNHIISLMLITRSSTEKKKKSACYVDCQIQWNTKTVIP